MDVFLPKILEAIPLEARVLNVITAGPAISLISAIFSVSRTLVIPTCKTPCAMCSVHRDAHK